MVSVFCPLVVAIFVAGVFCTCVSTSAFVRCSLTGFSGLKLYQLGMSTFVLVFVVAWVPLRVGVAVMYV